MSWLFCQLDAASHCIPPIIDFMEKSSSTTAATVLGPVPERRHNSIPGINVPYSRDNFIPRITSVPERRNSAIQGINLG